MIGKGGFSEIYLARNKLNNQLLALKIINKKFILENNNPKNILKERNILINSINSKIIKLHYAF